MRLATLAAGGVKPVQIADIQRDAELARDTQASLIAAGVLDPPEDGLFGPVSQGALLAALRRAKLPDGAGLDQRAAAALLDPGSACHFPLDLGADDLAARVLRAMTKRKLWICRHPDCLNLVYVEGMEPDGTRNANAPNAFNDTRMLIRVDAAGRPIIVAAWEATTEPGKHFTINALDPNGAARIAFGQFKAWVVGTHNAGKPSGHEALVQTGEIVVHRDLNRDFARDGDRTFKGLFGINHHHGFDMPRNDIGQASAGCLVGRRKVEHETFMALLKTDARYRNNNAYRFMAAVLPATEVT